MGAAGNVDAASVSVHIDVIPTTVAADGNGFNDVITARGRRWRSRTREGYNRKNSHDYERAEDAEKCYVFAHNFSLFEFLSFV
jgi:hypothetical protein